MDAQPAEDETPNPRITSRFIPLTRQAVIADLCSDPARKGDTPSFQSVALRLQRHRGHAYKALGTTMRETYLPFSPDRDTVRVLQFSSEERQTLEERFSADMRRLLERANYVRISNDALNEILNAQTPYSLRIAVDLAEYDELLLYAREVYTTRHSVRRPERAYLLKAHYEVRVYRRLFVLLKLKSDAERAEDFVATGMSAKKAASTVRRHRRNLPPAVSSDYIYVKVFKDLPEHDMQILLPLRTVQFRPFDKIKFFATAGGGTMFGIFSTTGKVLAATNPFALVGAFIGFTALLARQIKTFFNQRNRYMMELAQKLFFHNLANNRAALTLLLDRAEEEDVKEDLIALYHFAGERVATSEIGARKTRIDAMIADRYGAAVDFEIADTLNRLKGDGVVREEGDTLVFASLSEAADIYAELAANDDSEDASHLQDPSPRVDMMEA